MQWETGKAGWIAGMLVICASAQAAEVVGEVQLRHTGLFHAQGAKPMGEISVSLTPLEGRSRVHARAAEVHRMVLRDKGAHPAFLTIQRGDRVRFINQDPVYHEIFALSPVQPIELRLDKAGEGEGQDAEVELNTEGSWHLFCRIHSRMYARVDVVNTPLIQRVGIGETFRFERLQPGEWQLRVAALGAETRTLKAVALTSPPPLRIDLSTKGGGVDAGGSGMPVQGKVEDLFPRE